jgi:hypothetical protein
MSKKELIEQLRDLRKNNPKELKAILEEAFETGQLGREKVLEQFIKKHFERYDDVFKALA